MTANEIFYIVHEVGGVETGTDARRNEYKLGVLERYESHRCHAAVAEFFFFFSGLLEWGGKYRSTMT